MFDVVKNAMNNYKASQVELSLLKEDYRKDRDEIIMTLKECLKKQDYATACVVINKYKNIADDDKVFCALADEFKIRAKDWLKEQELREEVERLTAILEITPHDDYRKRYEIINQILQLVPNCKIYDEDIIECENALGLRPIVSKDLRLGRRLALEILGTDNSNASNNSMYAPTLNVRIHTHGVSVVRAGNIYRIHYSQIISMEYNSEGKVSNYLAIAAGAALGLMIGDGVMDVLEGANAGNNLVQSSHILNILYWNVQTQSRSLISLRCANEASIRKFIDDYNRVIDITKKTHREPKSEEDYSSLIITGCIIFAVVLIFLLVVLFSDDSESSPNIQGARPVDNHNMVKTVKTDNDNHDNAETSDSDSNAWIASESKCAIKKSGTTLTVSGKNAAGAVVEMTGAGIDACETVSVAFDKKTPISVKCSVTMSLR